MTNAGKSMGPDDLWKAEDKEKIKDTSESDTQSEKVQSKQKKKRKGKKQHRVMNVVASGLKDDTVEVKPDSEDELYLAYNCLSRESVMLPGHESMHFMKPGLSKPDVCDSKKIRMVKTSVGISKGRNTKPTYAVIDQGAEQDLVGCGWRVVHFSSRCQKLDGALQGLGSVTLQKVDAITAVTTSTGNIQLLGMGDSTWDGRITQYESLLNAHHNSLIM